MHVKCMRPVHPINLNQRVNGAQKKFQQQHRQPENTLPKITLVRFQNENEDLNKYESVSNKKVVANDEDEKKLCHD